MHLVDEGTTAEDMDQEREIHFFNDLLVLFGFNAWQVRGDDPYRICLLDKGDSSGSVASLVSYNHVADEGDDIRYDIIIHRLAAYSPCVARSDCQIEDAIAVSELHELSHWAMDDEFECSADHSDRWNPLLSDLIGHVTGRDIPT